MERANQKTEYGHKTDKYKKLLGILVHRSELMTLACIMAILERSQNVLWLMVLPSGVTQKYKKLEMICILEYRYAPHYYMLALS